MISFSPWDSEEPSPAPQFKSINSFEEKGRPVITSQCCGTGLHSRVGGRRDPVSKDSGEHKQPLWRELLVERFGQLEDRGCRVPVGEATAAWEELNVEAAISGVKEVELCEACMAVGWTLGKGGCLSLLS